MGISALGGPSSRFITKSGSTGGVLIPNVTGTSCNTPLADQTYGAWAQMVASTSVEYVISKVTARLASVLAGQHGPIHIDIATGASGSEVILDTVSIFGSEESPNVSTSNTIGGSAILTVPLRIPAGSRLVFRAALFAANAAANSVVVFMHAVPYANLE